MLGERIRKIRKQKKMTLEALAGTELTKGMLSLIENNKSKPSIESLTYIAEQLGVEVSDLLEEVSSHELREILDQSEKLFNTKTADYPNKYKELITLIQPYLDKLIQGYEAARLLQIYSGSLYFEKRDGWKVPAQHAAKLYDQMNITSKRVEITYLRVMEHFVKHHYIDALNIFLKEREEIETNHTYIDPMSQLDLDYHEAILHFSVGDSASATRVMENAITFSQKSRIYYLIDDLYRLAAAHAMLTDNHEMKALYSKKLKQYGEFAEDRQSIIFCELLTILAMNTVDHNHHEALERIERQLADPTSVESHGAWFTLEKGKTLYYLGQYEESIEWINKVVIPSTVHHPYDFSIFYVMDSYKALSYLELGNLSKALYSAELAVTNFDPLPPSTFKEFSLKTYKKILLENSKK
ncbi:helix-turn-helix domain-containing protein [Bacillus sp. PS06]|uniref:helix-turn-helix domain-containing protein n=1 Tax=Bacillus sp. PS06 TaxID=2764176 RepID=UPI00177F2C5A|nr:helix-turn-helix transcriptional regulator [Bacillus sp. PS06]MBD8070906.1 helix-turn-helix transcriptional regulator [Bacillus sp. PS06]